MVVVVVLHRQREPLPLLGELRGKKTKSHLSSLHNWDTGVGGVMGFTLEVAEHCGSQPGKHVNMSLNLSV